MDMKDVTKEVRDSWDHLSQVAMEGLMHSAPGLDWVGWVVFDMDEQTFLCKSNMQADGEGNMLTEWSDSPMDAAVVPLFDASVVITSGVAATQHKYLVLAKVTSKVNGQVALLRSPRLNEIVTTSVAESLAAEAQDRTLH